MNENNFTLAEVYECIGLFAPYGSNNIVYDDGKGWIDYRSYEERIYAPACMKALFDETEGE